MKEITKGSPNRIKFAEEVRTDVLRKLNKYIANASENLDKPSRAVIAQKQISEWQQKIDILSELDDAAKVVQLCRNEWDLYDRAY